MNLLLEVWNKAKKANKKIILPESEDLRILKASELITKSHLANVVLIGNEAAIKQKAEINNVSLNDVSIIDPTTFHKIEELISLYKLKRESKGMTLEKSRQIITSDYLFFASMLVSQGYADGVVSGVNHPTAHTLHAALQCIGLAQNTTIISSFFVMLLSKKEFGEEGLMFFADCGVNPNPTSQELAEIAMQTADSFAKLTGLTPKVAMLSFSTKGSATHPEVDKVIKATNFVKEKNKELLVDGELQADAALIPNIGLKKAPGSPVAGYANILIFPNLSAGNIGYKLTERLSSAIALGPILQGVKKPINDLSRGCSIEDIVNVTAITAVQAV